MKTASASAGTQRGMTLVELLAALVISALVVALASRLFLAGHAQYLDRLFETDRLMSLVKAKGAVRHALQDRILKCGGGKIEVEKEGKPVDLGTWLKGRLPGADSLAFRCKEVDAGGDRLVEWKERFQPQLIEYRMVLRTRGAEDVLEGSTLP